MILDEIELRKILDSGCFSSLQGKIIVINDLIVEDIVKTYVNKYIFHPLSLKWVNNYYMCTFLVYSELLPKYHSFWLITPNISKSRLSKLISLFSQFRTNYLQIINKANKAHEQTSAISSSNSIIAWNHKNRFPISFLFIHENEIINEVQCSLQMDYSTLIPLFINQNFIKLDKVIENLFHNCAFSHRLAVISAIEEINPDLIGSYHVEVSRLVSNRILLCEMERIVNHTLKLMLLFHAINSPNLTQQLKYWYSECLVTINKLKTTVGPSFLQYSSMSNSTAIIDETRRIEYLQFLHNYSDFLESLVSNNDYEKISELLSTIGMISREDFNSLMPVGPMARSGRKNNDIRSLLNYSYYSETPYIPVLDNKLNQNSVMHVTISECLNSMEICQFIIASRMNIDFDIFPKMPTDISTESRNILSMVEAPAGALNYDITLENNLITDLAINIPTISNLPTLMRQMVSQEIRYIPSIMVNFEMGIDPLEKIYFQDFHTNKIRVLEGYEFRNRCRKAINSVSKMSFFE